MGSCPSMAVCVLVIVAMWFSTIEGNCRRHCIDRCDEAHKNRKLQSTIGSCYRKCSKLAETCEYCVGPRRCLTCKRNYARTSNLQCVFNECTLNNGGCSVNAKCWRKPKAGGSFEFYCACNNGFTGNGTSCADMDECLTNNGGCDANAICTNTDGSYSCACRRGMIGDGKKCIGNLALNRQALQSTIKDGANASLAVDGSLKTVACSLASQGYANWLVVDLGEPSVVSVIVVFSGYPPYDSVSSGSSTLDRVKIGVSNTTPTVGIDYSMYKLCKQITQPVQADNFVAVMCPKDESTYRYVALQSGRSDSASLCIAEVQVYYVIPSDHFVGCYVERVPNSIIAAHWFDELTLTNEMCIAVCYSRGYKFSGTIVAYVCVCMTQYDLYDTSTLCSQPCRGDSSQICGGNRIADTPVRSEAYATSVYTTGIV